jgi:hydroxyacylglutathione hydrolase
MVLKRFYDEGLAHASYLIGCPGAGECAIVDPHRDLSVYLEAAEGEHLKIAAVTETHIHADYLSGACELARITGAKLLLSNEGGEDWRYDFAGAEDATLLKDGDTFEVGSIVFKAVHTPGHTPEHLSFIVTDRSATDVPLGALTGDFVFVGDVGRPDLLERAAKQVGTMEAGAKSLYASLSKFRSLLPDHAILFPAHGSGSACGKALGGVPVSTIGYEKASNWAFKAPDENAFVNEVLTGQPDPPAYFAVMKRMNKVGPALLGAVRPLPEFDSDVLPQIRTDTVVVDVRDSDEYLSGHVAGAVHIPTTSKRFCTYAGSVLPYDRPLTLIAGSRDQAEFAALRLRMIGLDDIRGGLAPQAADQTVATQVVEPDEAFRAAAEGQATLLDVRTPTEFEEGHSPHAISIPLGSLPERAGEIDRSKPVAIHCQSGVRS